MKLNPYILIHFIILLMLTFPALANWEAESNDLKDEFGITIVFDNVKFPSYWKNWNPKWSPVPINKRMEALNKLRIDLSHYSKQFLHNNLSKVYLINNLSFNEQIYGGTNDHIMKWLYLNTYWLGDNSKHDKAMGFHHELSSILYKSHKNSFSDKKWKDINERTFKYTYEQSLDTNIESDKTDLTGNKLLYEQGFLCGYGTLTLEDDINTFAQYLLAKPKLLKQRMLTYEKINDKANLLIKFYKDVGYNFPLNNIMHNK